MAIDELEPLQGEKAFAKVRELLAHFPIAFMVTSSAGTVHARPIGVVGDHAAFDGTLWFITDRRSRKVGEITGGSGISLIFQNDERGAYLHLCGRATVVEDRERLEELYTPVQRAWFPDGLDDPHMTLIRFDASRGHFWDGHQSRVRMALAFVTAMVTGEPGRSGNAGTVTLTQTADGASRDDP